MHFHVKSLVDGLAIRKPIPDTQNTCVDMTNRETH